MGARVKEKLHEQALESANEKVREGVAAEKITDLSLMLRLTP